MGKSSINLIAKQHEVGENVIELVFKCAKEILPFDNLHKYTKKYLEKSVAMNALLTGAHYSIGSKEKIGHTTLNYMLIFGGVACTLSC